ncbi:MAG TPA: multicopper oxidase domain-containing protein [Hyphomicrobiaceae bacterium]|nr:multicopper oxidase domain-containing protein [Hyphomicrobiaceae bacterium]
MYLPFNASKRRMREAQNARDNRAEIIKALSHGQITRRDLFKWGIFTATGALALKNGLSPFAPSAFAGDSIPTGAPPTPMFGVQRFTQAMPRLNLQSPKPMSPDTWRDQTVARWPGGSPEHPSKGMSYHTEFSSSNGSEFQNPLTNRGPMEGRPPGHYFEQQRWLEYFPKQAYIMSLGQIAPGTSLHPGLRPQDPNSIWTFGSGALGTQGVLPPPLIKMRYGEPVITRIYNSLPADRTQNNGFGRNEAAIHNHNAHNGSSSDGASNAHFFPGQFYDYHWSTTLARADKINTSATDPRASGPDGNGRLVHVPGDFRELQGSLWFHDHRFFFTAENVYKGFLGMLNYYSGPDRGHERLNDGVNLRLPSGTLLDWGNIDFDVNLIIADWATDQAGQYFFDIFNSDGFLGDRLHTNFAYAPYFEVLPRKYRFRILNGCMSRWLKLALLDAQDNRVRIRLIANDGNFLVSPIGLRELDIQGTAERFDVIIDFSAFQPGERLELVNLLAHQDGRRPDRRISISDMRRGNTRDDPAVGPVMQFRIVDRVESVDVPGVFHQATDRDRSRVPRVLTEQIPIVEPTRTRHVEFTRGSGDSRDNALGQCIPECGERESFPWTIKINGENAHSLNANRISMLIPKPGEIEHWTIANGGGGWDHPIHLHFEEGITIDRGDNPISATERLVRKDVWKLGESGSVKFQVQFGEFGGAYVNHCHNTVHEDFAMLLRYDILNDRDGTHATIIPTPNPTPDGVEYLTPEILPEGDPRNPEFIRSRSG